MDDQFVTYVFSAFLIVDRRLWIVLWDQQWQIRSVLNMLLICRKAQIAFFSRRNWRLLVRIHCFWLQLANLKWLAMRLLICWLNDWKLWCLQFWLFVKRECVPGVRLALWWWALLTVVVEIGKMIIDEERAEKCELPRHPNIAILRRSIFRGCWVLDTVCTFLFSLFSSTYWLQLIATAKKGLDSRWT